ncbi:MAG: helix-turn-helix domain-containing protein [Ilumatobacter sp.]|nr:helix-turn-helix domain-containing protein [Ilumatobacter sp.]
MSDTVRRAEIHAALGDPLRVAITDELSRSDRAPIELSRLLDVAPSLMAFHLDTLERAGVIERVVSAGDRRRRYVRLLPGQLELIASPPAAATGPVLFVCTHNSARSQLAAAAWRADHGGEASSAGTEPADAVHPGAVAAAARARRQRARPYRSRRGARTGAGSTIVTVCDLAHEHLPTVPGWHWSIPDPAADGTDAAFDHALDLIRARIRAVTTQEPR